MKSNHEKNQGREAIGVGRFSSDPQELGDSRTRQEKTFQTVCRQWHLVPCTRYKSIFDAGKSAYHGKHLQADAEFGAFLERVRKSEITPDSKGRMPVLVWEAVDRFSRMKGFQANDVIKLLIDAGFAMLFDDDDLWVDNETIDDVWAELQAAIAAARKYSKRLGKRMSSSWEGKRNAPKAKHHCPSWLKWNEKEKKYEEVKEQATIIREAVRLSIAGHGCYEILRLLPGCPKGIASILRERTLIGEYAPLCGTLETKIGYYPAVIDQGTFDKLQWALDSRKTCPGKRGEAVTNLFRGLIFDSADGCPMICYKVNARKDGSTPNVLKSNRNGKGKKQLDYKLVEAALLKFISEVSVNDLVPSVKANDELEATEAKLAALKHEASELIDMPMGQGGKLIGMRLAKIEAEIDTVQNRYEELRREQSTSEADSLAHAKDVCTLLASTTGKELESMRLRLRDALKRVVSEIWVYVVDSRHAEIQIFKNNNSVAWIIVDDVNSTWATSKEFNRFEGNHDLRYIHKEDAKIAV